VKWRDTAANGRGFHLKRRFDGDAIIESPHGERARSSGKDSISVNITHLQTV
jgi:hypothetical protein